MAATMEMACDERRDFADFLAGLTPEQWDEDSLCSQWRVRDVVAHAIGYDELSFADLATRFVRGAFLVNRINAIGTGDLAARAPEELVQLVRDHIRPRGLTAGFGGMIALVDGMIHQQDIRRPLNMPRTIPTERLKAVLDYALYVPLVRGAWRARGVRLDATDLEWSHGRGPGVRGPGEALLMAMAGRAHALQQLDGPGKDRLAQHIAVDGI
ncbi:maleylpyruvate isomerase family mycothiol-dependent enzyme [Mycolicibacterium rufum]